MYAALFKGGNMFFYVPDMWEVESVKEIKDVMAG